MERSRHAPILRVDIDALSQEVGNGDRLVPLRRHVEHVDALLVDNMDIGAMPHQ